MTELKPCPVCKTAEHLKIETIKESFADDFSYAVFCAKCRHGQYKEFRSLRQVGYPTARKATEEWNRHERPQNERRFHDGHDRTD